MILNELGAAILDYDFEFEEVMKAQGKLNPWDCEVKRNKIIRHEIDGVEHIILERNPLVSEEDVIQWEKYRDDWLRQSNEYTGIKLLENFGWYAFEEYCGRRKLDKLLNSYTPCDSLCESQCQIYCKFYDKGCIKCRKVN